MASADICNTLFQSEKTNSLSHRRESLRKTAITRNIHFIILPGTWSLPQQSSINTQNLYIIITNIDLSTKKYKPLSQTHNQCVCYSAHVTVRIRQTRRTVTTIFYRYSTKVPEIVSIQRLRAALHYLQCKTATVVDFPRKVPGYLMAAIATIRYVGRRYLIWHQLLPDKVSRGAGRCACTTAEIKISDILWLTLKLWHGYASIVKISVDNWKLNNRALITIRLLVSSTSQVRDAGYAYEIRRKVSRYTTC